MNNDFTIPRHGEKKHQDIWCKIQRESASGRTWNLFIFLLSFLLIFYDSLLTFSIIYFTKEK